MILAAEYTAATKRKPATLDITRIENGNREYLETVTVADKREARAAARNRGAVCWNF